MASIKEIKIRIESVKNTRQITNAMKMVSAAKLRKAKNSIFAARPYANELNNMLELIKIKNKTIKHTLLAESDKKGKNALVIVTSDRGLCGSFNANLIREAKHYLQENRSADLICLGKKGYDYFQKRKYNITHKYIDHFNKMDFSISREIAEELLNIFLNREYTKIDILYNEFKSAIQQNIVVKQLLPIIPTKIEENDSLDYLYEPDEKTIIDEIGKKYINVSIWRIMLESSAAEQGARMTAMDSATENASDLIQELTLNYNRARQAAITTEIIEIASGAEAIKQ